MQKLRDFFNFTNPQPAKKMTITAGKRNEYLYSDRVRDNNSGIYRRHNNVRGKVGGKDGANYGKIADQRKTRRRGTRQE